MWQQRVPVTQHRTRNGDAPMPVVKEGLKSEDRRARRRRETRTKLTRAAQQLMARSGPDAVTIQEITDTADVGFGSFYNYFESKDGIVEAVMNETLEVFGDLLDRIAERVDDPAEVLAASVRHVVRKASEDKTWGWLLIRTALVTKFVNLGLARRMTRDIRIGVKAGRFKITDPAVTVMAAGGSVMAVIASVLHGEMGRDAPERAAAVVLKLLGLSTKDANKLAGRPLPEIQLQ